MVSTMMNITYGVIVVCIYRGLSLIFCKVILNIASGEIAFLKIRFS